MARRRSTASLDRPTALERSRSIESLRLSLSSEIPSPAAVISPWVENGDMKRQQWKHALGIMFILATVMLWTVSNFLASTIFADDEYSKPFFVTYINTAFFIIPLFPAIYNQLKNDKLELDHWRHVFATVRRDGFGYWKAPQTTPTPRSQANGAETVVNADTERLLKPENAQNNAIPQSDTVWERRSRSPSEPLTMQRSDGSEGYGGARDQKSASLGSENDGEEGKLLLGETAKLSLYFCVLWYLANYFAAACLSYTTVASATILTSTSSIWTLFIGAITHVEQFTVRKLLGVLTSLAGIAIISSIDMTSPDKDDESRGSFPFKTRTEVAIGDALALLSALAYGFYSVYMKKWMGNESRINMPLFFGFVGLFNILLLWPALFLLHVTGIETFEIPPTGKVLTIIIVNSVSSLVSDYCWAYGMLLTSPLLVTVGLSLTIPLSLVGQMIIDAQYSSVVYWIGAGVVVLSFVFINHEEKKEEEEERVQRFSVEGGGMRSQS